MYVCMMVVCYRLFTQILLGSKSTAQAANINVALAQIRENSWKTISGLLVWWLFVYQPLVIIVVRAETNNYDQGKHLRQQFNSPCNHQYCHCCHYCLCPCHCHYYCYCCHRYCACYILLLSRLNNKTRTSNKQTTTTNSNCQYS